MIIKVDRTAAAIEGLDPDAVNRQLQMLVGGAMTGQIQEGEKVVGLRIWTPGDLRQRVEALAQLRLRAPDGHDLPLSRVASISVAQGLPQVTRENLQPFVAVTGRLEKRDLGSAMREVRRTMAAMSLPSGVRIEYGGLYAEQQKSFRDLALVFAAAVLLVSLLLLYVFENWACALSIMATVLLAAASVFVGLWLTRTELNISALMGLTMVVGIVTELAIFYFAELDLAGAPTTRELLDAGRARLRPILMSALIAIMALSPLALGIGEGSAMQTPLAIAIISGLIAGVPLVLLVLPALFAAFSGTRAPPGERRPG